MKHIKFFFWILLVNGVCSFDTSYKTNVNDASSMSLRSNFPTLQTLCDSATTNITTMRTLNRTSAANDNTLCVVYSSEPTDKATDFDVQNKIEYYYFLEARIWRIFPPILLGKKERLLINKLIVCNRN